MWWATWCLQADPSGQMSGPVAVGTGSMPRWWQRCSQQIEPNRSCRLLAVWCNLKEAAMGEIRVGVIGCGHLGKIHARLLAGREDCQLVGVVDPAFAVAREVAEAHGCEAFADPQELVGRVDAAIVAAPTGLHAEVAIPLLKQGVDLLIEKPLAASVEDARAIVVTARRLGRTVAVGHVEGMSTEKTPRPVSPTFFPSLAFLLFGVALALAFVVASDKVGKSIGQFRHNRLVQS
ncbi:MAG: hypothetical protein EBZ13_03455 [Planctomycetia bacterium]|nr:hypothetical protein [Planctomycetia bacterium]